MKNIPERLKDARQRAGLTQGELADKIGVSSNTIANAEKGSYRDIKIGLVCDYARITHTSAEHLLHGDGYCQEFLLRFDEAREVIDRTLERTRQIITREQQNKRNPK